VIHPSRAFYRPGEPVEIPISVRFRATIWHLAEQVAVIEGIGSLQWLPPPVPRRGYRVRIETEGVEHWTAFDVLTIWTDAPRYGYLFDFSPQRTDFNLDWLLAHHVNSLQFYDWQYRHDTLLPPVAQYEDPLGRRLSLETVRALIDTAHRHGMAAMPYTAIYAASPAFAAAHSEWGLYDSEGRLYDFADSFLKIMNPASPWREHYVLECRNVLAALPFDGIHVDQYGEPRAGFDALGQLVDLPEAFARTLGRLHEAIPQPATLVFNLVHNWPLEAVCKSPVDFLYCELWPPKVTLGDIADIVILNWTSSGGRSPTMAVYVNPGHEHTVRLVQSVITASGGYHIAHGEDGLYLSDPYFPRSKRPSSALACHVKRIADFAVAYEELLAFAQPVTIDADLEDDLLLIARRAPNCLALNLLNASPSDRWNEAIQVQPARNDVAVSVAVDRPVDRVWWASPDMDAPPQPLNFHTENGRIHFIVPQVETWSLVAVEFAERP
jgi:dextranase